MWIVGAGGVGREVHGIALTLGLQVEGFLDDRRDTPSVRGLPLRAPEALGPGARYVVAIADAPARARMAGLLDGLGAVAVSVVHPAAVIAPLTQIGSGCIVMAGAHVSTDVTVHDHVQVQYNATVGHDAVLRRCSTVLPGAHVSGTVEVGEGATIGSGAVVLQGRRVGPGAFVGAGAVVTRDVPQGETWVGAPARPVRG